MKLMKATLRRLWRLTRATSIVVGLAVMVALEAPRWRRGGGDHLEGR
jgi:hypothetical protein